MAEVAVDDGEGIPPNRLKRYSSDFSEWIKRAVERPSTGWMAIVKHIVHSHGGKVRWKAALVKGSVHIESTLSRRNQEGGMICSRTIEPIVENRISVSNCHLEHVENGITQRLLQQLSTEKELTDE